MNGGLFWCGYCRFICSKKDARLLFSLLQSERIEPNALKRVGKNEDIGFCLPLKKAQRFRDIARDNGLDFRMAAERGAPVLWRRLIARPGLFCGILLGVLLLVVSRLVLWEIEIEGESGISEEQLLEELSAVGLRRGRFLAGLDRDGIALTLRLEDGRLSYANVNIKGTVAHVQVRESQTKPDTGPTQPANLVARVDGVITLPLIFEGECAVEAGDAVRAGDILASGIIDTQNHGYRVTRAAGQVFARTVRTYRVFIPYDYTEKAYTGREKREITVFFFDSAQKVLKNSGNNIVKYDIIKKINWWNLPDGRRLPLGWGQNIYAEYVEREARRDVTEARTLAFDELDALLAAQCGSAVLLQKTTDVLADAAGVTLLCTAVFEEDIAAVCEFSVTP